MSIRHVLYGLPLLVFLGMSTYFAIGLQKDPSIIPSALLDKPVPAFDLPPLLSDIPGLATADFGGEVVLVNVFASWCVPCRAEHAVITRLANQESIPVFGLNWKDTKADATAWLQELGNPYSRIGHDLSGRAGIEWGVYGVPETYIIGREGRIRFKQIGPLYPGLVADKILPVIRKLRAE